LSSWTSVILLIIIIIALGIFVLRKYNRLPSWLSNFSLSNPEDTIAKLKQRTKLENDKAQRLQTVLAAKQELTRAKAINSALRREIASVHESNIPIPSIKAVMEKINAKSEG